LQKALLNTTNICRDLALAKCGNLT